MHHGHGAEPGVGQVGEGGSGQARPAPRHAPRHAPTLQRAPERASELGGERVVEDRINGTEITSWRKLCNLGKERVPWGIFIGH